MRRHAPFFAIFFTAIAIIMSIGAFFLAMGMLEAWRGHASLAWPAVEGRVIESSLARLNRRTGTGRRGSGASPEWTPRVRYEFEVDGVRYESERVDFMTRAGGRIAAEDELRGLETGATVTVRYDPHRPTLAVLRPGNGPWDWIPPLAGVMGLVVPPAFFLLARRWIRIEQRVEKVSAMRRRNARRVDGSPRSGA